MEALGRGDVNKLADLGAIHGTTEEQRRALWQKTIERSKHYLFTWRITDAQELDPKTAAVRLQIRRDLQLRRGQDEMKYELPLTKDEKGDWKVDVGSMDRGIYPALPRG
jgi:hypothetical protein